VVDLVGELALAEGTVSAHWRAYETAGLSPRRRGVGVVVPIGPSRAGRSPRHVLVAKANDYSFPSDHSVIASGADDVAPPRRGSGGLPAAVRSGTRQHWAAGPRTEDDPRGRRTLAAANVVLGRFLCFAWVYVGAHYPGDVVAGYLLASLVVLVLSLLRPLAYWVVDTVEPTLLGTLLCRPGAALTGDR